MDSPVTKAFESSPFLRRASLLTTILLVLFISGCTEKAEVKKPAATNDPESVIISDPVMAAHTIALWLAGTESLNNSAQAAKILQDNIQNFLSLPNEETLVNAQQAWQQAHNAYLKFEVFTFLGKASPDLFGELTQQNFNIHAWPITPGYIDYFHVYATSGMVNDIALDIAVEDVRKQHGFTDDSEVSIGFHTLEYLLWGELGQRPIKDYAPETQLTQEQGNSGVRIVDLPNNRRRALLGLLSQLLVDDISRTQTFWNNAASGPASFYAQLTPESKVQLWRETAIQYIQSLQLRYPLLEEGLTQQSSETEVTAATTNNDEQLADPAGERPVTDSLIITNPDFHNQYAGQTDQALANSIKPLEFLLFEEESGLGQWLFEAEKSEETQAAVQALLQIIQENDPKETSQSNQLLNNSEVAEKIQALFGQLLGSLAFENNDGEEPGVIENQ